ncbi:MAG: restriction endonuclease subunit S, partial [Hyphomonas sp.]|nr:restriction endonuclease subunit S [Hyphomonas sp.]
MTSDAVQVRDDAPRHGVKAQAQDVPPGYKWTEVGVIPEDWEVRLLSQHFRIYAGGDVPKHSLSQTRSASHPYPVFANALQNHGLYGFTNERRSRKDSLTITARGFLGHAEYRDEPFFPIVRLLVLEPIGQLDARFATYAVNDRVKFAFESTGVPQLTAPQVGKYSIASPQLPEQCAIAEALSDVDGLLGALEALIAKKRAIKQAAMQQLLTVKTRLPGFSGEWETASLDAIVTKTAGFWGVEKRDGAHDKYVSVIRAGDISPHGKL